MSSTFFIASNDGLEGPYDLLSMIRKIKNGRLTRLTMVTLDPSEAPFHAEQHPVLREVMDDLKQEILSPTQEIDSCITLFGALRGGWDVFQINPTTALTTGVFAVVALFGILLLSVIPFGVIQGILCALWCALAFSAYLITLSRKSRMQIVHSDFYRWLMKKWRSLIVASLITCSVPGILPSLLYPLMGSVALPLVFVPGALWVAYFLYVPLIITDRSIGVREALSINAAKMREAGVDFYSIVLGLVATNVIVPVLPITMPVTLGAACDIYDRVYNEY
jgi:hypothetical protein